MGFKIGDKVVFNARLGLGTTYNGRTATVKNTSIGAGYRYGIRFDGHQGFNYAVYADELTAVETLKLEKGATVRLKGGLDEWVVQYTFGGFADIARPDAGAFVYAVPPASLVVVRGKPAPPKPDYYVNCKGERPQDGDVFVDDSGNHAVVTGTRYEWCGGGTFDLDAGFTHSVGRSPCPRTLLVRAGKPYVGG